MINAETKTLIDELSSLEFKNKLVASYIHLEKNHVDGYRNEDIINDLNKDLGVNYKPQRLMDWRNGSTKCPARVEEYMRKWLLQYLFEDEMAAKLITVLALEEK